MGTLSHLDGLEAEAIYIMREVAAECEKPVMLYSIGKDSSVMLHLAMKAFYPEKPPFPFMHIDTTWKFKEMIEFRDRKAKELGMKETTFYNPSGLPTPSGNYSSVYDMALLTKYAMNSPVYQEIVKTKTYKVTTNKKTYLWHNKNKLLKYDYITGGKTGYTEESGRTLVSTANIDNMSLIVVTIRDSDDWNTHIELYNYAKDNYYAYRVLNKNKFKVYGDNYYKDALFYIKNNIYIPLKKSETKSLISHIKLDKKKNYQNNTVVGVDQIYLGKELIYEEDIYITKNKNIAKESILSKIKKWFHD